MAQPSRDARPQLTASLSLADLDRVRQALQLLSEEPDVASVGPPALAGESSRPAALSAESGDDDDTTPLPVVLPAAVAVPRPEVLETPRGPFEPARIAASASVAGSALDDALAPPPAPAVLAPEGVAALPAKDSHLQAAAEPAEPEPAEPDNALPPAAAEKLDQIKDLLITAEAIGEANLDRHFDRVSQRQRELIREFFERARPGQEPES